MRLWAAIFVFFLSIGCREKPRSRDEIAKAREPALTARLGKLVAAAAVADAHKYDSFENPLAGPFSHSFEPGGNAIAVQREDLADIATDPKVDVRFLWPNHDWVRIGKATLGAVTNDVNYSSWSSYESRLDTLQKATHVLVVVPRTVDVPGASVTGEFQPGKVEGVAILVEIETGAFAGGFTFSAANREEVTVKAPKRMAMDAKSREYARQVIEDLDRQFGAAISNGIMKRWPGAKAPDTFWDVY